MRVSHQEPKSYPKHIMINRKRFPVAKNLIG